MPTIRPFARPREYILCSTPIPWLKRTLFPNVLPLWTITLMPGLSVKMIDGKGRFLPESKRALPTPMVSFYKIFGLSVFSRGQGYLHGTTWGTSIAEKSTR